jgi:two-component system response regulator HydG
MKTNITGVRTAEVDSESAAAVALRAEIERVAVSEAKVLISGESGTGKEVAARAIHARSLRAARPFVVVNCAGIPETLLESELFGHIKGSFTGAYRDQPGKLETADRGTLLLDEVGETTLRMQGLLLRFLETGELQRVGMDAMSPTVDVRVLAATNRPLERLVADGLFREDLYYRLNVVHLRIPPLRERREDIPSLIRSALGRFRQSGQVVVEGFEAEAMQALVAYDWPGNIRELQNVVERLAATGRNPLVRTADLPVEIVSGRPRLRSLPSAPLTVADELYQRVVEGRESFWTVVYPLFMNREITKANVRDLVGKGLEESRGNYKIVARLFNMAPTEYKRFLNFLRKHECQVPFREYR